MALRVDEGYSARASGGTAERPSRAESMQVEPADAEPPGTLTCRDVINKARQRLALKGYRWE